MNVQFWAMLLGVQQSLGWNCEGLRDMFMKYSWMIKLFSYYSKNIPMGYLQLILL